MKLADRRQIVLGALAAALSVAAPQLVRTARGEIAYPRTKEILRQSRAREAQAYRRYIAFSKQAAADGYPGIAYLFAALATAELIHGQNFEKILARMGTDTPPPAEAHIDVGTTQQNLIRAVAGELSDVDTYYPGTLKDLAPEGYADAITFTTYAWETEKQHRDILESIRRWTPSHFEAVAKKIDKETGNYFVCQICGGTSLTMPRAVCPICKLPATNYRKIEPPVSA